MSSPTSGIDNVEKVFSKAEETLEMVEEAIPKLKSQAFSTLGIEPLKQIAGWYIDTAEDLANYGFVLQESGMSWSKDMPWAHLFRTQASIARKLIGNSAVAARLLWQIPPPHHAPQHKV